MTVLLLFEFNYFYNTSFPSLIAMSRTDYNDQGSPGGSAVNSRASAGDGGDTGLITGSGRSSGNRKGNPLSILAWKNHGQRSLAGYSLVVL